MKEETKDQKAEQKAKAEAEAKKAHVKFLEQDALTIKNLDKDIDKILKNLQKAILARHENKRSIISMQTIQRQLRAIKKSVKRLQ